MSSIKDTAEKFFAACETGQGWEACSAYCHADAAFAAQADALADISTLADYTEWMKNLYTPMPDAAYDLLGFAVDEERNTVLGYGVFKATHTAEGGPISPTGKRVEADYVYAMEFDDDKIRKMTKIWNDTHSLRQLGWA